MSTHDEAPQHPGSIAARVRAWDRAIPNPLLALPLVLLALALLAFAPGRITGDTFFDLVAGRDIVQHGLPHADRLMAFTSGQAWQDQQWLAHLMTYGVYLLGGLPLVSLVDTAFLVAALFTAMLAARALGGAPTWIAAVACPVMLVLVPSTARAQTLVLPLFAVLVWLLARDSRTPDRRILLVIPLLVLWANLHGSVLLASALVLLRCAIGASSALHARRLRDLRRPLALGAAALLAPFASPYGPKLISLLLGHRHERRVPQDGHRVGRHHAARMARLLRVRRARRRRDAAPRDPARPVREALRSARSCSPASTPRATSCGCRSPRPCCYRARSPSGHRRRRRARAFGRS